MDQPQRKRRRVDMPLPDGFAVTKHPKAIRKPHTSFPFDQEKEKPTTVKQTNPGNGSRKTAPLAKINDVVPIDKLVKLKNDPHLRPVPPPPPIVASTSTSTLSTTSILNVSHKLPNSKPSSRKMAILELPVALNPNPGPDKRKTETNTRTISSLTLGMLNDSASENMLEEVAFALLRDQHSEISAMSTSSSEIGRGLDLSPRKKDKNHKPKLARGGLATRAAAYIDRSYTDFLLWRKEVQHNPNNLASAEFCASIIKVLHSPTSVISPCIALCRIRRPNGASHPIYKSDELYRLVFTLPSLSNSVIQGSFGRFCEEQDIYVFKPWHEISFSFDKQEKADYPRLPASLPLPLSIPYSSPNPLDAPISNLALLCSRFHVACL